MSKFFLAKRRSIGLLTSLQQQLQYVFELTDVVSFFGLEKPFPAPASNIRRRPR